MITRKAFFILFSPFLLMLSFDLYLSMVAFGLFLLFLSVYLFSVFRTDEKAVRVRMRLGFACLLLAGVLLTYLGGVYYWPDRPMLVSGGVKFKDDPLAAKEFFSFSARWRSMHKLDQYYWGENDADFVYYSAKNNIITDSYLRRMQLDGTIQSIVIPTLKQFPKTASAKNVYMYKSHFPTGGPVFVQVGNYKVKFITEFEDKIDNTLNTTVKNHYQIWKIDDIASYEDVVVPDTFMFCNFGFLCWLPPPASNF